MSDVNVSEKPDASLTDQVTGKAADAAGTVKEQAASTAGTAKEQASQVASVARDEAQHVAEEAKDHAKALLDEALKQAEDQSRAQRDRLVGTLQTFSEDLERMASAGQGGLAADLSRQLATRARDLSGRIDGREPTELLSEVKTFAQRRPGTFLLGALAAGVVAGRLVRGAKDAPKDSTTGSTPAATTAPGFTPAPVHAWATSVPSQSAVTPTETLVVPGQGAL